MKKKPVKAQDEPIQRKVLLYLTEGEPHEAALKRYSYVIEARKIINGLTSKVDDRKFNDIISLSRALLEAPNYGPGVYRLYINIIEPRGNLATFTRIDSYAVGNFETPAHTAPTPARSDDRELYLKMLELQAANNQALITAIAGMKTSPGQSLESQLRALATLDKLRAGKSPADVLADDDDEPEGEGEDTIDKVVRIIDKLGGIAAPIIEMLRGGPDELTKLRDDPRLKKVIEEIDNKKKPPADNIIEIDQKT